MRLVTITATLLIISVAFLNTASFASAQEQNSTNTDECKVIIGIDSSGVAFNNTKVNVMVGDTVCWVWENESMGHNVVQVDSEDSNERKAGGVYSGEAETTVDFRHTFTEDETFYYVCEPHTSMDMRGVITVGIGTIDLPSDSNDTPGFGVGITLIALLVGLLSTKKSDNRL
tara:strand:+ start:1172 stop:1687 length:516 start_codon:yes stop_codon:yes gene_type:complete